MKWKFWKRNKVTGTDDKEVLLNELLLQVANLQGDVSANGGKNEKAQTLTRKMNLALLRQQNVIKKSTVEKVAIVTTFRDPKDPATMAAIRKMHNGDEITCGCGSIYKANWTRCLGCGRQTIKTLLGEDNTGERRWR